MELSYTTVVSVTLIAFTWAGCESASASSRSDGGSLRLASASESPQEKPSRKMRQEKQRASAAPSASGMDGQSASLPARIPIVEEELHVGTRQVEGNKVRITINPVETPVKESVRVKREQIVVDREPGGGGSEQSIGEQAFQPRTIELVEMAEVPTAGIQPVVTNLITIRKEETVRSRTVQDKLRGTKAEVSREPQQMASSDLPAPAGMAQRDGAAARASEPLTLPPSETMKFPVTVAEVRQSLVIDKQEVPAEKVRISIQPTERPAEQTVQLREERIVIERTPISETVNRLPREIFSPQSVDIALMKEEPVVSKQPKVKEWLTIRKNIGEQERTVEANLKETNVALVAPEESR